MHKRGIYHRDIKPDNILIMSSNFHVRFCDFGLSSHITDSNNDLIDVRGTPGYKAPEHLQIGGYVSSQKSDVFSLGAVFYHLVSGNVLDLVVGETSEEVVSNNTSGTFNTMQTLQNHTK